MAPSRSRIPDESLEAIERLRSLAHYVDGRPDDDVCLVALSLIADAFLVVGEVELRAGSANLVAAYRRGQPTLDEAALICGFGNAYRRRRCRQRLSSPALSGHRDAEGGEVLMNDPNGHAQAVAVLKAAETLLEEVGVEAVEVAELAVDGRVSSWVRRV
jgi:hypothetical protein